jgi:hypothetical protein
MFPQPHSNRRALKNVQHPPACPCCHQTR